MRSSTPPPALLLAAALATTLVACKSEPVEPAYETSAYVAPSTDGPEQLGYYMAQLDKSLRRWSELKLKPASERDRRTLVALEANLNKRTWERQDELVAALEAGPRLNREVAAMALGFTQDPAVLSPLLAALNDTDARVAQKALLGIGILGLEETPLSQIEYLLIQDPDPWTRNNAAYALVRVVAAGARSDALAVTCRQALIDDEPGVRAQAASVLGILHDDGAVPQLGDLLLDDANLVVAAAATALARIGANQPARKGECARLLVKAYEEAEEVQRPHLHLQLAYLRNDNLGEDVEPWREWAYRLP